MQLNLFAAVLGFGFLLTGLFAFSYPALFFSLLGDYYGTFNYHFVKDAGIAFFSSGALILLSIRLVKWRVPLMLGGALFVVLHGLFHVQMLVMGMAPTLLDITIELLIIILPSVLSAALLVLRIVEQSKRTKD